MRLYSSLPRRCPAKLVFSALAKLRLEGCLRPVVDVVVDEEQIAPGAGGDIASRAVDGVAVEQHHAAGRPCSLLYTVALDQPGQAVLVRYAELLTAQGLLIVVLRGLP